MAEHKNYRKEAKENYCSTDAVDQDFLRTGAVLRMADSLEIIAKDKTDLLKRIEFLEKDCAYWRERYQAKVGAVNKITKSRDAFKGLYNKLKNSRA